jgi:signal transduction histidine kinase/ligand-binding sensor domain-containing protein
MFRDERTRCVERSLHAVRWLTASLLLAAIVATPVMALDPSLALTQYVMSDWQSEEGLPQNSVYSLLQSRDGYLWVGTEEGLVRFDGIRFVVFDKRNTRAIRANWIRVLREANDGSIWFGTIGGGLVRMHRGLFTSFTLRDGLPSDAVWDILEERPGVMIVATDAGVVRLAGGRFEKLDLGGALSSERIRAIATDSSGRLWIGSDGGGLARSSPRGFERVAGLASEYVTAIHRAADGSMWVGTTRGVVRFAGDSVTMLRVADGLPNENVRTIFEDHQGTTWIGLYGGGLARVRGSAIESLSDALPSADVSAVIEDDEGDIWLGTGGGGLVRLASRPFSVIGGPEGLDDENVRSVLEDRNGATWIGTRRGLVRMRGREMTSFTTANGLAGEIVYALFEDGSGAIWAGTEKGVSQITSAGIRTFTTADGLGHETVRAIVADHAGRLWVATTAGLSLREGERFRNFTRRDGLTDESVLALRVARDGVLWIGTQRGLTRHDDGRFRRVGHPLLDQAPVIAIEEDEEGAVWAATGGKGLFRIRNGEVVHLTSAQGLFDDTLMTWLDDGRGNFWSSSNRGIFRVRKSEIRALAEGTRSTVTSVVYDVSDGLRSNECNGGSQPAGWRRRNGRLLFASIRGVATIDPAAALRQPPAPRLIVEEVTTDAGTFTPDSALQLPPGSSDLSVQYTAVALSAPEKVRFRYWLEGFGSHWVEAGGRRVAYFTNVPAGSYRFLLSASSGGEWSKPVELRFAIEPRFFETWWFRGLLVALGIALLFSIDRLRHWRLRAEERKLTALVAERTRSLELALADAELARAEAQRSRMEAEQASSVKSAFLASMSHELRTPMNSIIGFSEVLEDRLRGKIEPRLFHFQHLVLVSAHHLLQIINDILDLSKVESGRMEVFPEVFDVRETIDRACATMSAIAARVSVELVVDAPEDIPPVETDPGKVKQILFNLLSNAVKFSPPGSSVVIRVRSDHDWLSIVVIDHGGGISPADMQHVFEKFRQFGGARNSSVGTGLGLALVKEYAELLGGRVSVESKVGEGSRFEVRLPMRHPAAEAQRLPDDTAASG